MIYSKKSKPTYRIQNRFTKEFFVNGKGKLDFDTLGGAKAGFNSVSKWEKHRGYKLINPTFDEQDEWVIVKGEWVEIQE